MAFRSSALSAGLAASVALVAILAPCGCAPPAPAAPPPHANARVPEWNQAPPAAPQGGLAVIVGGGVSLGAYQAGYLYALSEELKREGVKPSLYAGASAGTINALLLGIEMCRPSVPDPPDSTLRRTWMAASLAKLRGGRTTTSPTAVFPQDGVRSIADVVRTRLTAGIARDCDFVLSAQTTRLHPRSVPIQGNDAIPEIQEPFTIRISVGQDGFPRITNYVPDDPTAPRALLPFPATQDVEIRRGEALDLLIELVLASSAFPGAFPQVMLPHCLTDPADPGKRQELLPGQKPDDKTECGALPVYRKSAFLDGGILDNTPVGLAIETARSGWSPPEGQGHGGWSVPPRSVQSGPELPTGLSYLFVDTDNDVYDPLPTPPQSTDSFLSFAGTFAGSFVGAARGQTLHDTLGQYPELGKHLTVSRLHARLASRYLLDFFGFFDTRLRDFDFTGGMYDAARLIADGSLGALLAGSVKIAGEAPALTTLAASTTSWRKLACMAEAYASPPTRGSYGACLPIAGEPPAYEGWQPLDRDEVGTEFESFVEVLQASLDEAYSQCACAQSLRDRPPGDACQALLHAGAPPRIRPEFALGPDWIQGCEKGADGKASSESVEDAFAYAVRRLAHYGFAGASVADTQRMVRDRIGTLADDTIARQPVTHRLAAMLVGPLFADSEFVYTPPSATFHVVGGLATEAGVTYGHWIRAMGALQIKGWRDSAFAVTPLAAIDWNIPQLPAFAQVHAFARAGFQFGNTGADDVVATSPCWENSPATPRSASSARPAPR